MGSKAQKLHAWAHVHLQSPCFLEQEMEGATIGLREPPLSVAAETGTTGRLGTSQLIFHVS